MRNWFAVSAVLVMALVLVGAASSAKSDASPEKGIWKLKVVPDAEAAAKGEKEFEDTLILKGGKLRSTACEPYGFGSASYKMDGNTWMSDMESKKEGKNHWHGEVDGDHLTGRMTWTKADGTVLNYTFEGHRAEAQTQTRKS
ncbi:MAG TPA: hypothetical protein VKL61_11615 [Candidatus Polarisedimenticolia bacterium]|nr:hypothetical protein [Candidatus Polarisedimenticolia bacterium]